MKFNFIFIWQACWTIVNLYGVSIFLLFLPCVCGTTCKNWPHWFVVLFWFWAAILLYLSAHIQSCLNHKCFDDDSVEQARMSISFFGTFVWGSKILVSLYFSCYVCDITMESFMHSMYLYFGIESFIKKILLPCVIRV